VWVAIEVGAKFARGINRGKQENAKGVSGWRDLILELLGLISHQTKVHGKQHGDGLFQDATEAGMRLGYGSFFKACTPEQVHTVYSLSRPSTATANGVH
jgi:hypothetical protein